MDNLFALVIVVAFVAISLLGKLRQRNKEEQHEEPPVSENPEIEDLTETIRRMIYGDRPVPTARPASPDKPVMVRPVPREDAPYEPPLARPTSREQQWSEPSEPVMAPRPRPVPAQLPEDEARYFRPPAPEPAAPEQFGRPAAEPQEDRPVLKTKPKQRPSRSMPARERGPKPHEGGPAFVMFKDLDDIRRAVVLSEILAPPLAFR